MFSKLRQPILANVPPGRWAVGVSGGADSVALLSLLRNRPELSLHVAHLDHQTRGDVSREDAKFVTALAVKWGLPCTVALRGEVERTMTGLPSNPSARYRAARMALFRRIVDAGALQGVILAHHADDQAETVLQRLIRGSGPAGLAGMAEQTRIGGLLILRPLLKSRRQELRDYLAAIGQDWREDTSNASDDYLRNRLRRWLQAEPKLHAGLLQLADRCRELRDWGADHVPVTGEALDPHDLSQLPRLLANEVARCWLVARGAPAGELTESVLRRLIEMATDAASPSRQNFPGGLLVRRKAGQISAGRTLNPVPNKPESGSDRMQNEK